MTMIFMDPILTAVKDKLEASITHFKTELSSIRAGRANPALIENISVDAYGGKMKMLEVGTISAPQPSLLTIQIWDPSLLDSVIKAIQEANLGLNPASDGVTIRLPIPPLTGERRQEFIKHTHQRAEEAKVSTRQIRQDARQDWKKQQEDGDFGEDELERREKLLQDLVEKKNAEIEELAKVKEAELTEM